MIIPKKIIKSKRKTLSLQINENGELIVRVPKFISDNIIHQFIERNREWIDEKIKEIQLKKAGLKTFSAKDGEEIYFLGRKLKLKIVDYISSTDGKNPEINLSNDLIIFKQNANSDITSSIQKLYKSEAIKIFRERVDFYIDQFNKLFGYDLSYGEIKISNGRKILGSCSSSGNLNFSWRLIQAPIDVIDYVVVHEIVHLKVKNHKRTFWLKVNCLKPDYEQNIKWLKDNWYFLKDFLNEKSSR